uniref:Uncharacterized protein n=1 Tax=Anguilla anguilla TaxID=7936 RepID=A0A0E9U9H7_ANGAN
MMLVDCNDEKENSYILVLQIKHYWLWLYTFIYI